MKDRIIAAFIQQSKACATLGSPFTARICELFATQFKWESRFGEVLENWSGDPESNADNVPLRLAGALNALVLSDSDPGLAKVYPPRHHNLSDEKLWAAIEPALIDNHAFIEERLKSPPQTNELRRSAVLLPAFLHIATRFRKPMVLSEIGSSSGLNLLWDKYAYQLGTFNWGSSDAEILLQPHWQGPEPENAMIVISERAGCDLNPLDLLDDEQRNRALSYIWPDQTERVERTQSAIKLFKKHRPTIEKSDAFTWLERRLTNTKPGVVHVIFHSVVLQYFPPVEKEALKALITRTGEVASEDTPLAWLQYEADGAGEGAGLSLTTWPGGTNKVLARADFHGRWVKWNS